MSSGNDLDGDVIGHTHRMGISDLLAFMIQLS
jgi:hypothetical protein